MKMLIRVAVSAISLAAAGVVCSGHGQPRAMAAAAPGVPEQPKVIYGEDFENRADPGKELGLADYTGASGHTYTADAYWLDRRACNGFVLDYGNGREAGDCDALGSGGAVHHNNLRTLPYALGTLNDGAPEDNSALVGYTAGKPTGQVEFETKDPITNPAGGNRFLAFSVHGGVLNCQAKAPLYQFQFVDGTATTDVGGQINSCTSAGGSTVKVANPGGGTTTARVGTYSTEALLHAPGSFKLRLLNKQNTDAGNDGAIDDIVLKDVTPSLGKAFSPAKLPAGSTATLTFTITNTAELGAKAGWSFTDALPTGMTVAEPAASTTCSAGTVTAPAGGADVSVKGDLTKGQTSCTVTVHVTAPAGKYVNGPDQTTETGLDPPPDTPITFEPRKPGHCSDTAYLMQGTDSSLYGLDLATGTQSKVSGPAQSPYNAFGYNRYDGKLYGIVSRSDSSAAERSELAVVDPAASGKTPVHVVPISPKLSATTSYNAGDVSADGKILYVRAAGNGTHGIIMIDVDPGGSTAGRVIGTGPALSTATIISDLSHHPRDGMLYSVTDDDGTVIRIDPGTGKVDTLGSVSGWVKGDAAGATFMDELGNLYAVGNDSGKVYEIDLSTVSGGLAQYGGSEVVGKSQPTTQNDGGACLVARDFGDAPDSYKTLLASDGPRHKLNAARDLLLGSKVTASPDADTVHTLNAANDSDDEGVSSFPTLGTGSGGASYSVTAAVHNTTGTDERLSAWIDFDRNGHFDTDERATATVADGQNSATLTWKIPAGITSGTSYARLRLGPAVEVAQPTGEASNGEVEDYKLTIEASSLKITKTATPSPAKPGQTVTYTVTVQNTGTSDYTGAAFKDDLTGVLDDAAYNADAKAAGGGTVSYDSPVLSWTGALPAGQTATVTYSVSIKKPSSGDKSLKNTVTSSTPGGNCSAGSTDPACTSNVPVPTFTVKKKASTAKAKPGGTVTYTITVTNGSTPYTGATFTDDLSDVLDDAAYNADAKASAGTVAYASPRLTWTGDLAAGQVAAITYTVKVT
ncbi:DUF11 domain-containing protein [Actinomadura barringtoniae]|uniref:DUF11 domain-containing protein n=1 Tax=Actinomadura barringtoniae TaxID=1427535 RepID=A0A939T312_9ACTN|nr:GEVED domain-containing protein [Actinomadura barringtoniae]MBO2446019.1 DUF11 domain-containing protein [Actinomadura barringtoniae]